MESIVVADENTKNTEEAKNSEPSVNGGAAAETAITDTAESSSKRKNQIKVSKTKKPLIFYLNLAKKLIKQYNDVELCALGMAIPTVVIISEYLKRKGLAIEKSIMTSTVKTEEGKKGWQSPKPKIEILLGSAGKEDLVAVVETSKVVDSKI
ncbi:hypothetical protein L6164_025785 [Bauhinia variegata]|uniref:Uncharacterized protein n=1 Tax=Bauhinia variegata TaxID=167791 RepID=A0ACB9M1R4_BAUVA|nr:hypothetical protein L6164_025785 [Bauhinia variegata]